MNKYSVSVWNAEFVFATDEKEAEKIVKEQFLNGNITRKNFEFDDVELIEKNVKNLEQEYKVLLISSVEVDAINEQDAIEQAYHNFYDIKTDDFEIQVEQWGEDTFVV